MEKQIKIHSDEQNWGARLISLLPVLLPAALASFGIVAISLLLLGQLQDKYIWPLGFLAVVITAVLVFKYYKVTRPGSIRQQRFFDVLAIAGVFVWLLFNIQYTSQNVFVYRDPAIYTVTGAWLKNNQHLNINPGQTFGKDAEIKKTGAGFGPSTRNKEQVYAQGAHLLPAYIGLTGRVFG